MRPVLSLFAALFLATTAGCASPPGEPRVASPSPGGGGTPKTGAAPAPASPTTIDGATAKKLVREGAILVDVRSPEEFASKHVTGATNVPVDDVKDRDLGAKDKAIVVYCGSGRRSARAAETLRAKGYTAVYDLGAMSRWDE